jgi:DNA mismatch repair protein MutL
VTRRIQILPDSVANQIAAGEVVERPASVVKELVENSLDARATRIDVEVERAGRRKVRVTDNGEGMARADALLCLDRHATSKIEQASDLQSLRSFGFRGEALPSIAAVSRLILETRGESEEVGTALRASGGRILAVEDCPRQRGTTVDVQGLFFNAPARAKFLKAQAAETRAIADVISTLSFAHPTVAFRLSADGRVLLELAACEDVVGRVSAVWGPEATATLLPIREDDGPLEVRGLVQRPDAAEPGYRRAALFVNGRPFREPALVKTVDRAFRTTVAASVRPWMVLYLTVPDGWVDVNVHPAKTEVRFRDLPAVEALVERAVRSALSVEASAATFDAPPSPPALVMRDRPDGRGPGSARRGSPQMALFVAGDPSASEASGEKLGNVELRETERPRLWQLHATYVLAETREGLHIIDQHSAHERVLFERLMKAFGDGGEPAQRLLFPLTLRLSPAECRQVEELSGLLRAAGFDAAPFGGESVIVHAVPNPHPYFDAARCFREMVAELTEGSELVRSARNQHERIAMTFACKGAIKAGQRLSEPEMQHLFDALFATELPYHDVHGRPTIVRLSTGELERKFGR